MTGPLAGLRIIELAGIGPVPFAGMMLADHGADVVRIERPDRPTTYRNVMHRSRRSVLVDLKRAEGVAVVRRLCAQADGLIEGMRPGVMERLGLGPDLLLGDNPRLVYGRMTGWGQDGPMAQAAGHDLNYIALSGALYMMGRKEEKPPVPLNLVGDFGGGGMLLAFGMVSAILAAQTTGRGQVVDAAMSEGSALLMSLFYSEGQTPTWPGDRGSNMLGGAAPFYDTYETADGGFVALSCIEPQFYAQMLRRVGLSEDPDLADQLDRSRWPAAKEKLAAAFRGKTREEWCVLMEGSDACFAPVLSLAEAPRHAHNLARGSFLEAFGRIQPAPAPRFLASGARRPDLPMLGAHTDAVLGEAGYSAQEIAALHASGTVLGSEDLGA
jgi:alpha-methylacyl-CoA racemase